MQGRQTEAGSRISTATVLDLIGAGLCLANMHLGAAIQNTLGFLLDASAPAASPTTDLGASTATTGSSVNSANTDPISSGTSSTPTTTISSLGATSSPTSLVTDPQQQQFWTLVVVCIVVGVILLLVLALGLVAYRYYSGPRRRQPLDMRRPSTTPLAQDKSFYPAELSEPSEPEPLAIVVDTAHLSLRHFPTPSAIAMQDNPAFTPAFGSQQIAVDLRTIPDEPATRPAVSAVIPRVDSLGLPADPSQASLPRQDDMYEPIAQPAPAITATAPIALSTPTAPMIYQPIQVLRAPSVRSMAASPRPGSTSTPLVRPHDSPAIGRGAIRTMAPLAGSDDSARMERRGSYAPRHPRITTLAFNTPAQGYLVKPDI
ncbi:uncharacterized protein BJ171DRAFT_505551 [Polychytrium aggregatum]|uniref:uncharacterized protein n=1 Tax=Polychytrium aggregatum TaxID=110093 RepID=UPI0022FF2EAF|nr:uncharacterized protein BJ171DRAFT_505551 [Polychytrium aggregatum]KAI9204357.1 hypothetical protein BJ171DRAFT_505551 [Polychytrium aggregatum]